MREVRQSQLSIRSHSSHLTIYIFFNKTYRLKDQGCGGGQPGLGSPQHTQCYSLPQGPPPFGISQKLEAKYGIPRSQSTSPIERLDIDFVRLDLLLLMLHKVEVFKQGLYSLLCHRPYHSPLPYATQPSYHVAMAPDDTGF